MFKSGMVLLVGLWCSASCLGCGEDPGTGERTPGRSSASGRFAGIGDGIARDTKTGLEWTSHDKEHDLSWHEAERYCEDLALGGNTNWRLPEIDELGGIYDESLDRPCGDRTCHLDPVITLTSPYVWSGTERASARRFYFDFAVGSRLAPRLKPGLFRRALCVRGRTSEPPGP